MSWIITGTQKIDPDAAVYLSRVETVDGQPLEAGVRTAVDSFFVGCKADGIWNAIKASCILAGARTLAGALVPLVGTAPTNVGPFVSGDYNRKTGLKGGFGKYLNSNRANNADPQDSKHLAIYKSEAPSAASTSYIAAQTTTPVESSTRIADSNVTAIFAANNTSTITSSYLPSQLGFMGVSRTSSANVDVRANGTTASNATASNANMSLNITVFARNLNGTIIGSSDARLAFYSIGESLALNLLDTRITTLINALAAAIP